MRGCRSFARASSDLPVPDNPRYVMLQDGKGYCCPGAARLVVFDANTLAIQQTYALGGKADFAQAVGDEMQLTRLGMPRHRALRREPTDEVDCSALVEAAASGATLAAILFG